MATGRCRLSMFNSIQFNSVYFQHTSIFHTITTTCTFCAGKGASSFQAACCDAAEIMHDDRVGPLCVCLLGCSIANGKTARSQR